MAAITRPAVVVDGQHRLKGAVEADIEIMLPVVVVPNCAWAEQIYQFVVINRTAKNVKQDLLTDILGSSLTPDERRSLDIRLARMGLKDTGSRWAATDAARDEDSPFKDMVSLDIGGTPPGSLEPFITEATIRSLIDGGRSAKGWRTDQDFLQTFVLPRFSDAFLWEGLSEGLWRPYWYVFWHSVAEHYNGQARMAKIEPLWTKTGQTNLTKGVALRNVQNLFMIKAVDRIRAFRVSRSMLTKFVKVEDPEAMLAQAADSLIAPATAVAFGAVVKEWFLSPGIPLRFFTADWHSSLDTTDGQAALQKEMEIAWSAAQEGRQWVPPRGGKVFK